MDEIRRTFFGNVTEIPKSTANGAAEWERDTESRSGKMLCSTVT
jgi:hypothetical protein